MIDPELQEIHSKLKLLRDQVDVAIRRLDEGRIRRDRSVVPLKPRSFCVGDFLVQPRFGDGSFYLSQGSYILSQEGLINVET
jgi:hypothetical protein